MRGVICLYSILYSSFYWPHGQCRITALLAVRNSCVVITRLDTVLMYREVAHPMDPGVMIATGAHDAGSMQVQVQAAVRVQSSNAASSKPSTRFAVGGLHCQTQHIKSLNLPVLRHKG